MERKQPVALNIETDRRERTYFIIDGVEYYSLAGNELSRKQEGNLRVLLSRDQTLTDRLNKLDPAKHEDRIDRTMAALQKIRTDLVLETTNVPRDVVDKLTSAEKAQVFALYADSLTGETREEREEDQSADRLADEIAEEDNAGVSTEA